MGWGGVVYIYIYTSPQYLLPNVLQFPSKKKPNTFSLHILNTSIFHIYSTSIECDNINILIVISDKQTHAK